MDDVVALILNYNSYNLSMEAVDNLISIAKIKIVLVDNCSTDDSYNILMKKFKDENQVKIIRTDKNLGYASGNNFGFKYIRKNISNAKYVMLMNPDIHIKNESVINELRKILDANLDYSVASCQLIFNNKWRGYTDFGWRRPSKKHLFWAGTLLGRFLLKNVNYEYTECKINKNILFVDVDVVPGCFFMARITDLDRVGYFDERTFLYFEETILSKKLSLNGKKELILLNEFVFHNHHQKDMALIDYKKKFFDRECFHNSKMVYVNNYSDLSNIQLKFCNWVNNMDFKVKKILYSFLICCTKRGN